MMDNRKIMKLTETRLIKFLNGTSRRVEIKPGVNLYRANLLNADLRGTNLQDADLRHAYLQGANLRNADLKGANLKGANLYSADLQGANLIGANLYHTYLLNVNLTGAKLNKDEVLKTILQMYKDRSVLYVRHFIDALRTSCFDWKELDVIKKSMNSK